MDYIGSKKKLLDWIFSTTKEFLDIKTTKELRGLKFLDGCAGSGAVSLKAARLGMDVTSNDVFTFSGIIVQGLTYISDKNKPLIEKHLENLSKIEPSRGLLLQ